MCFNVLFLSSDNDISEIRCSKQRQGLIISLVKVANKFLETCATKILKIGLCGTYLASPRNHHPNIPGANRKRAQSRYHTKVLDETTLQNDKFVAVQSQER